MAAENEIIVTVEPEKWEKESVFKLPPQITSLNKNAFHPIVISFGPYHHNEQPLKPMEAHKLRSFNRFLYITNTTRQDLVQSFKPMEQELMDHYDQLGDKWRKGDRFLELMIRDGCFMLEILRCTAGSINEYYSANDPVFGRTWHSDVTRQNIKRDMLLIENQLPLLVLEKLIADNKAVLDQLKNEEFEYWRKPLVGWTISEAEFEHRRKKLEGLITEEEFIHKKIHHLILNFFESDEMNIQSHDILCLHALDVFRENMIKRRLQRLVLTGVTPRANFRPATDLHNTGVTFKRNNTFSFMDITFGNRVLTLPSIFINKETELTFLNLMAFERLQAGKGQEVSAYINLMDSLVRSAKDVRLLRKEGIIKTTLKDSDEEEEIITTSLYSDEEIARLFHKLAESQIVDPDDSLDHVRQRLANHYKKNSRSCKALLAKSGSVFGKWRNNFGVTYCTTPIAFIGLVVGTIALVLTAMQTYYTALPYYRRELSSIALPPNSTYL